MSTQTFKLILASQSPRRKVLLEQAGYEFQVMAPDDSVECEITNSRQPDELVAESSFLKAKHISAQVDQGIVLAADTVADCDGQILGKPKDREHAKEMLTLMSNREHRVLTGVTLWDRPSDRYEVHIEQTILKMDAMPASEFEDYLDSGKWRGKAGAFGYQDGLDWIHIVEGSESNVVGLPMESVAKWLGEFVRYQQQ